MSGRSYSVARFVLSIEMPPDHWPRRSPNGGRAVSSPTCHDDQPPLVPPGRAPPGLHEARSRPAMTPRTKIVCTIGPASVERVDALIAAGMSVARVNLAHGTEDEQT